ncbi:hypothetical protein M405DRAFT_832041 [Rhizopogon salebrosus TDB-379]|nr:hypothetical protein M405DRAFT_832041 [Rhizopogon salebrosus TDB-379]
MRSFGIPGTDQSSLQGFLRASPLLSLPLSSFPLFLSQPCYTALPLPISLTARPDILGLQPQILGASLVDSGIGWNDHS